MLIDRINAKIIELLQNNARLSNKELAAAIGLAPSTCLERVRRLNEASVFLGFHAEVDPKALGTALLAMIAVRLGRHSYSAVETFRDHVLTLSEVRETFYVAGANDFLIHVAVRDADHLRDLVLSSFSTRSEVSHIETSLIFEYKRKPVMPSFVDGL